MKKKMSDTGETKSDAIKTNSEFDQKFVDFVLKFLNDFLYSDREDKQIVSELLSNMSIMYKDMQLIFESLAKHQIDLDNALRKINELENILYIKNKDIN